MRGLTPARLRLLLALLFVALAVPSAWLILQTQRQLKWEALHQQRELAAELAERIDAELQRRIVAEEARGYDDYLFARADAGLVQRSILSQLPAEHDWPGLIGWFQIDPDGRFSSPVLPQAPELARGIEAQELALRRGVHDQILDLLARNRLTERRRLEREGATAASGLEEAADRSLAQEVADSSRQPSSLAQRAARPAPAAPQAQRAFDELNVARDSRARRDPRLQAELGKAAAEPAEPAPPATAALPARRADTEITSLDAASPAAAEPMQASPPPLAVHVFDPQREPFELARLDSGHFVLFRRVWRNGERSIQGALIDPAAFVAATIVRPFTASVLAGATDLAVLWQGGMIEQVAGRRGRDYAATASPLPLHRARLSAPLSDLELQWSLTRMPVTPGAVQLAWSGAVLFGVLGFALLLLYRLGLRQLQLVRQQRDFVAAVSHELKTPLTSIRMYGELLRAGWVDEARRQEYYAFIHDESERLSRLIANVLQLARLERDEIALDAQPHPLSTLLDLVRSKVHAVIERAGFQCSIDVPAALADVRVQADADAFVQIIINLVDNAVKFSAAAERRCIEIRARSDGGQVVVSVRDHGPGVPPALRRRIFDLFVRGGSELTRETQGTGIGLALARQLARGMGGDIDVMPAHPGAEFRLHLPAVDAPPAT